MRTLKIPVDNFDSTATFKFALPPTKWHQNRNRTGYLFRDEETGTIFVMQGATVIAASYTAEEIAERNRLNSEEPIKPGDQVEVDGRRYQVGRLGDYSDAGKLIPLD